MDKRHKVPKMPPSGPGKSKDTGERFSHSGTNRAKGGYAGKRRR